MCEIHYAQCLNFFTRNLFLSKSYFYLMNVLVLLGTSTKLTTLLFPSAAIFFFFNGRHLLLRSLNSALVITLVRAYAKLSSHGRAAKWLASYPHLPNSGALTCAESHLLNDDQVRDLPLVGKIEWKTLIFFLCFHFKLYVSTISPGNQNLLPVLAYIFMPLMYV